LTGLAQAGLADCGLLTFAARNQEDLQ